MVRRAVYFSATRLLGVALAAALVACVGCSPKKSDDTKAGGVPAAEIPPRLWEQFSGENALKEVARQVEIGPRPSGSGALAQARARIMDSLKNSGWDVERQEFDLAPVPGQGSLHFVNLIARFSPAGAKPALRDTQRAIIGSHYDTKRMDSVRFLGANDGGSSTGALLELARVLAKAPALAAKIELVFFDGEEDAVPAIIIFMPIINKLTEIGHINPLHMGVVIITTLVFGLITPPYGLSLLVASKYVGVGFSVALRRSLPLYVVFLLTIAFTVLFPEVVLWLPTALLPESVGCFKSPSGTGYICP